MTVMTLLDTWSVTTFLNWNSTKVLGEITNIYYVAIKLSFLSHKINKRTHRNQNTCITHIFGHKMYMVGFRKNQVFRRVLKGRAK